MAAKPVPFKKIAEILDIPEEKARKDAAEIAEDYKKSERGLRIVMNEEEAEMVSAPENEEIAAKMRKGEIQGELSQAALEVLSVILNKGSVSKDEIEEIRGVNCSIILRNLLMRGLIEKSGKSGSPVYKVSLEMRKRISISPSLEGGD